MDYFIFLKCPYFLSPFESRGEEGTFDYASLKECGWFTDGRQVFDFDITSRGVHAKNVIVTMIDDDGFTFEKSRAGIFTNIGHMFVGKFLFVSFLIWVNEITVFSPIHMIRWVMMTLTIKLTYMHACLNQSTGWEPINACKSPIDAFSIMADITTNMLGILHSFHYSISSVPFVQPHSLFV